MKAIGNTMGRISLQPDKVNFSDSSAQAALSAAYEKQGFSELAQQAMAKSVTAAAKEAEQYWQSPSNTSMRRKR